MPVARAKHIVVRPVCAKQPISGCQGAALSGAWRQVQLPHAVIMAVS